MLKVKSYPKRSPYLYLRGTVAGVRVFESTETTDPREADEKRAQREAEIYASAGLGKQRPTTAAEAMSAYLAAGGERRFILPLLEHFKDRPISEIRKPDIDAAAEALYPDAKPSTRVRQVYTPMKAVLKHALETEMPGAVYRKIKSPAYDTPPANWGTDAHLEAILEHSRPRLRAWILVSTYTGLRASEMIRQRPRDYTLRTGWVNIGKTKNGEPAFVPVPPVALEAVLDVMPGGIQPVFGYSTVQGVNSALRRAAARASKATGALVPYLSSHEIGRHSFAARLLNAGHDIKTVKEAGRWKKLAVVDERYGHLEMRTVHEAMLKVAEGSGKK